MPRSLPLLSCRGVQLVGTFGGVASLVCCRWCTSKPLDARTLRLHYETASVARRARRPPEAHVERAVLERLEAAATDPP